MYSIAAYLLSRPPGRPLRALLGGLSLGSLLSGSICLAQPAAPDRGDVASLKKMSLIELAEVEVTSVSRRPEKLADTASAIQVITADEIHRSGVSTLPEALRLATNLEVAQKNAHDWGITARGFNTDLANKLLVMIDGRTVYSPLFSGVFWDVQDYLLEDLDRIEVISGPGGTAWGANAVNGVINVVTKSARDTQGLLVQTQAGDLWQNVSAVRYGGNLAPNVYYRVYAKYSRHDDEATAAGAAGHDAWSMSRAGFRIDSFALPQNTITFQGDGYGGEEDQTVGGNSKVSGGNLLGRWTHTSSPDAETRLQTYYDRTHLASFKPANIFGPEGVLADDLDTFDVDFQQRFRTAQGQEVVWGAGYRRTHDVVSNAPTVGFLPPTLNQDLFSAFAQDEFPLGQNMSVTVGTKVEHNGYTGFELEPSVRLKRSFARQMIWTALSRAVRTPSRIDRDLIEPTNFPAPLPSSLLNGSPDFASERVWVWELGYRAQLTSQLSGSVTAFYNRYDRLRSTATGPAAPPNFGFPFVFENNLEGETHGLELSVQYQPLDWWRLRAGYDFLAEHLHVRAGAVDFNQAHNETADPRHQWALHSSMDLPYATALDAALRWVDRLPINNGGTLATLPSYAELDLRLAWHPRNDLELSLVGQNLLHRAHPEYGAPGSWQEIQRSVFARVTWTY